ncbi:DNA polymerase III subunit gamma and tau [Oceanitalea stevensii]|uniref:DNA-directed DNA polymerase n=1 Tax=Oceanitalea stevensii TaxID=2763072 RepID=A0ABR8Z393_9MICO|nr:DNA polymerase III subunit gamma and tau [Oceanitalea stevensii]MBD8062794.1 DNA polymerase III subunit gamma and tau [Oceanitalea stevensii]
MSTALYRRYRPETFADVIGQEHVTDPLRAALKSDRITHAYLFSGPRGCGKTTSARIFARCLNCAEGPTDTPCGVCPSCVDLARGGSGSLDVVEMDAASHGGVDDARELRERAAFAPARDRYKVFIIDEAHMVTSQGFNALLKLVEEPPAHVKFVFATTEPEKVIGTIRSRTHHYPFRLVPPERLQSYLEELCTAEGVRVATGVLPLVVRAGGGSVRDSLSVLDQLIAGAQDGEVSYERAVALLGYTHATLLDDVVDSLAARDGASLFRVVDRVIDSGHDPRRFAEDLLERIRDLVVIAVSGEHAVSVLRSLSKDQFERMQVQSQQLGPAELTRAGDLVNDALTEMSGATSPRLQLELMCARLLLPGADDAARGHAARLDRIERHLSGGGGAPAAAQPVPSQSARAQATPVPSAPAEAAPAPSTPAQSAPAPSASVQAAPAQAAPAPAQAASAPSAPAQDAPAPSEEAPAPAQRTTPQAAPAPAEPTPGPDRDDRPQREDARRAEEQPDAGPAAAERPRAPRPREEQPGREAAAPERADDARSQDAQRSAPAQEDDRPAAPPPQREQPAWEVDRTPERPAASQPPAARQAAEPQSEAGWGSAPASPAPGGPTPGRGSMPSGGAAPAAPAPATPAPAGPDADLIRRRWPEVLSTLARFKRTTWALVSQNAQVGEVSGGVLHLAFATSGLAHTFGSGAHTEHLQRALLETLGVQLRIEPVLSTAAEDGRQGEAPYAAPAPATSSAWGAPDPAPAAEPWGEPAPEPPAWTSEPAAPPSPAPDSRAPAASPPSAGSPSSSATGRDGAGPQGRAAAPRTAPPAPEPPAAARIAPADDVPSMDDPDAEHSGLVGAPLIERMLGGTIIHEE